jgi:hypothetical protein
MVTAVRRSVAALIAAAGIALLLRLRGSEETPPLEGGWRELSGPDLR